MQRSDIEWTTFTSNPIKYRRKSDGEPVWACVKTSPGCANCYAEAIALRFRRGEAFTAANMREVEPYLDEAELRKILTAKTIGGVPVAGSQCFVGDMTDIFGEWVTDAMLDRLLAVFALRPDVTFQVLTKRAERMAEYMSDPICRGWKVGEATKEFGGFPTTPGYFGPTEQWPWPLSNVHFGVSVEDQQRANERIPHLLRTPAAVRFLSAEPLLGPVTFDADWVHYRCPGCGSHEPYCDCDDAYGEFVLPPLLNWVIVGGESGPKARPCDIEWIRSIVRQCREADVPCFVKQTGSRPFMGAKGFGPVIKSSKGGDPAEWPEDLRVRQFPHHEPMRVMQ